MPLDLPDKKERKVRVLPPVQNEALSPQDTIEYGITEEVSTGQGRKAWIRFASTSSVRDGETTEQAIQRVSSFVEKEIDRRIDALDD